MKIVVVGDWSVPVALLEEAAREIAGDEEPEVVAIDWAAPTYADHQARLLNLEKNGPEAVDPPSEVVEAIPDADVLLVHTCPVSRKLVELGRNLRLIGTCRGGMEHIDVTAATDHGIPVIHCIRNAECTSDFAVGLMFAETRNIARGFAALKRGEWRKAYANSAYTTSMCDMTVGIVGLGHIGKLVAKKCAGLGMKKVIAYDPFVSQEAVDEQGLPVTMVTQREVFETADIVSLHLRVTPETKNSISAEQLGWMKPTAYLVNTSRAGVLDKDALVDALQNKTIGGAALDVFWDEPLQEGDPLLDLDNVTITPHIAGQVVDALTKSPLLLAKVIKAYWETGRSDMVVNARALA